MKRVLGLLLLISVSAMANPKPTDVAAEENTVMSRLVEQIFNTIDQSAIDLNIDGITIDSENETSKVTMDKVRLTGMVSFAGNWEVDVVNSKDDSEDSSQMKKVYPKIQADAKNLKLEVDMRLLADSASIDARFLSHYDTKTKQWVARPLTVKVSNQMNKQLLNIRLFSLRAEKKVNAKNPKVQDIVGVCQSDKILLDLATGQNKQVPVNCSFSGTITEKGYKLQFQFANK